MDNQNTNKIFFAHPHADFRVRREVTLRINNKPIIINSGRENVSSRATIAWQRVSDTEYRVGIALCSPRDNFCRKEGREYALEALTANPITITSTDELTSASLYSVLNNSSFGHPTLYLHRPTFQCYYDWKKEQIEKEIIHQEQG